MVSTEHLQGLWHASRLTLTLPTPGSATLRTCLCSNCWDQFPWNICSWCGIPVRNASFCDIWFRHYCDLRSSNYRDQFSRLVSMEHLQRIWHASRERSPFWTPGSTPFGTCLFSNCWDKFSRFVSMEYLQRVWHASNERLPFRTPGSAPFGACLCSNCWCSFTKWFPKSICNGCIGL